MRSFRKPSISTIESAIPNKLTNIAQIEYIAIANPAKCQRNKNAAGVLIYWVNFIAFAMVEWQAFSSLFQILNQIIFDFLSIDVHSEHEMLCGQTTRAKKPNNNTIFYVRFMYFSFCTIHTDSQWQSNVCTKDMKSGNVYNFQYEVLSFFPIWLHHDRLISRHFILASLFLLPLPPSLPPFLFSVSRLFFRIESVAPRAHTIRVYGNE